MRSPSGARGPVGRSPGAANPQSVGSPVRLEQTTATGLETARRRCLRRVLERYLGRAAFRVIHVSIQKNHLHLLVEAADRRALTAGMQSFAINAARALDADPHGVAREARARVRAQ